MDSTSGYQHLSSGELQYTSESSPSHQLPSKDPAIHQRTYQACIPCRGRKVRCNLGSPDNPHDPPCVRCKRELKECYFSATRRKKKNGGSEANGVAAEEHEETHYQIKSGKKRLRGLSTAPEGENVYDDDIDDDDEPRTPGGSVARLQPLRRPQPQKPFQYGAEEQKASDETAAMIQKVMVNSGHDALKVLSQAAQIRERMNSKEFLERPSFSGISPESLPSATSPIMDRGGSNGYTGFGLGPAAMRENDPMWKANSDHRRQRGRPAGSSPSDVTTYNVALKAWSRYRFVRAGWMTAKEGIEYVQYFYKHLAPLTPVAVPDFRNIDTHEKLLTQEPMLSVTILLIASRHMKLEGPGALSRPYAIHDKLWKYLSGMINRLVWGQEQFGGGFCGAGAEPASDVNPLTRKGLRTLGTLESLVLLTEWHPRAMHFPPEEDDDELMAPDLSLATPDSTDSNEAPKGFGGQRMDAWLEPCWRSDRMCWMLLGMAMSLAFEIGVFDSSDWHRHAPTDGPSAREYHQRRGNVRDLLRVYVTQTSGRLGLTSMLPDNYSMPEDSDLYYERKQPSSVQETILHFWLRMAAITRESNKTIFANKAFTRDLIKNGTYQAALEHLREPLVKWRQDFDSCASIPPYMRHILVIEYEYCRMYMNALALQAVAERCANGNPVTQIITPLSEVARSAINTNGERADVAIDPQTLAKWLGGDRKYLLAVGDGARIVLKTVVEGLYPGQYLRHAPVRTYFRIISAAVFLIKSFALGACESEVAESLTLMDRTVEALKTCIVDDVHVASRFAELLSTLTESLKPHLIRISADGRSGRAQRSNRETSPIPVISPSGPRTQGTHYQQTQPPYEQQTMAGAMPNQQQWNYNNYGRNNDAPPNNPLLGISLDSYDLIGNDFSVMPPPNFGFRSPTTLNPATSGPSASGSYDPYASTSTYGSDPNFTQDWLTLPLDNILNMGGAEVNQTMYGPQIGDQDMLEMLLGGTSWQ
ncbi:hypothetical protein LTR08_000247 [Meristemomyces frigidus]|nr:hypothetical protein LTR08_000247 [Meristemomyces frigidus]